MASGAPDSGGQFVEAGQGFSGILLGSQALRWTMSGTVLGDVASRHQLYLAAKPSNVGVMLPVRHCTIPSCYSGGGAFPMDAKPPSLNI
jgi:hypothetical protein